MSLKMQAVVVEHFGRTQWCFRSAHENIIGRRWQQANQKSAGLSCTHESMVGTDGELVVLNVQAAMPSWVQRMLGAAACEEYYGEQADAVLNPIKRFLDRHIMRYRCSWVVGSAADEIVQTSKRERSHLIVMGTHGRGFVGRVMMGSVAQRVIAESEIPLILVK